MGQLDTNGAYGSFTMQLFLTFVDHCIRDERFADLQRCGLSTEQILTFDRMSTSERTHLVGMGDDCLEFSVNRECFDALIEEARAQARQAEVIGECIAQGAPYEMMNQLFDISNRAFRRYRKLYRVPNEGARCTDDPEVLLSIDAAWRELGCKVDGETLLSIKEATKQTMRLIWSVVCQIEADELSCQTIASEGSAVGERAYG